MLPRQAAEASTLCAQNQRHAGRKRHIGERHFALPIKADDFESEFLELFDGADEIRDPGDLHPFKATRSCFCECAAQSRAVSLGGDERFGPENGCRAENRSEIMWIRHLIQHDHARRALAGVKNIEIGQGRGPQRDSLMDCTRWQQRAQRVGIGDFRVNRQVHSLPGKFRLGITGEEKALCGSFGIRQSGQNSMKTI